MTPFIDAESIIRVGGRLENSSLSYQEKYPILLPYNDHIVKALLKEMHIDNMHCGTQALLATSRQIYWIIKGKIMARNTIQTCIRCTRAKPKLLDQLYYIFIFIVYCRSIILRQHIENLRYYRLLDDRPRPRPRGPPRPRAPLPLPRFPTLALSFFLDFDLGVSSIRRVSNGRLSGRI